MQEIKNQDKKENKPHEKFLKLLMIRIKNILKNRKKRIIIGICLFIEIMLFIFIYNLSKGLFYNSVLPYYANIIVKFSFYAVIILLLLLIFTEIIIFIGRTKKSKAFKNTFIEYNIYNSNKELPILEDEIKSSKNCKDYIIDNMKIGKDLFSKKINDMEAIINEKILYVINPPNTSKKILIRTQDWKSFSEIKEIGLKNDDLEDNLVFLDNIIVIGRYRCRENNIYQILAWKSMLLL